MTKRRTAAMLLALLMITFLILPVAADDMVKSGNGWHVINSHGYEATGSFFDLSDGFPKDQMTPENADGVHLEYVHVSSDYITDAIKSLKDPNSIFWQYNYDQWMASGYFLDYDLSEEILYGFDVTRKGSDGKFNRFTGQHSFSDKRSIEVAEYHSYTVDVRFNAWIDVEISNFVLDGTELLVDVKGYESYRCEITTGYTYVDWRRPTDAQWQAYYDFRDKTQKTISESDTKRAINLTRVPASYVIEPYEKSMSDVAKAVFTEPGGFTMKIVVIGIFPHDLSKGLDTGITQFALNEGGEDEGVSVPVVIVIGVASAAAAIGGAAAAAGGGSGDAAEEDKKKTFKMYVQKDFADAIRRGGPQVKVRARMAEVGPDGRERDRDDLTSKIAVIGENLTVHSAARVGRYCEATVSAPENVPGDEATITFLFEGAGGTFSNNVVFRLVDGPEIRFVEESTPGSGQYQLYNSGVAVEAIPGDRFTYTRQFLIIDATTEVVSMKAEKTEGFSVTFEPTDKQYLYRVHVRNDTPAEPEHDLFETKKDFYINFSATLRDEKEPVEGFIRMEMYPEGLTVQSREKGRRGDLTYVRVQSYEKEHVGDLDKPWQVSEMTFTLAVKGETKALIDPEGMQYTFAKIKGAGGLGMAADKEQAVAEKYKYKEAYGEWNDKFMYTFEPNSRLYEPDNGTFYMILLPVECQYKGDVFKAEVPLRLMGKELDPLEEWEKEYKKTRSRIERFSLPGQKADMLKKLEEIAIQDTSRISTFELRLMSKDIVYHYIWYWTDQHTKDEWTCNALNWAVWGLEWVKWIGDCAFSYVVAAYTGPCEPLISAAKDVMVNIVGEIGVNIVWGTKFDPENLEILKTIKGAGDNMVSNWVGEGIENVMAENLKDPTKWKLIIGIMGGYFAYKVVANYLENLNEGKNDFYGAIMDAFKDLTVTALKTAASAMFKQWLNSENFKKKIGPKIQEYMKKWFGDHLQDQTFNLEDLYNQREQLYGDLALKGTILDRKVEVTRAGVVESYLTGLLGEGVATVFDKAAESTFSVSESGEILFTFCLWKYDKDDPLTNAMKITDSLMCTLNLSKALYYTSTGFFGFFYDLFFKGVPAADVVMEIPKDPPLPAPKK